MKGQQAIIDTLNGMLADELTAINQYMVHSEMCSNWGYAKLHGAIEQRAMIEMKHAERLIARIIFLDGRPTVSKLNSISIGADVETQLRNDLQAEMTAVSGYNAAAKQAVELVDHGTRDLFESILVDEEAHVDWLEAQLDQIAQMGIQNYLSEQAG
jgi:bacterioferritin